MSPAFRLRYAQALQRINLRQQEQNKYTNITRTDVLREMDAFNNKAVTQPKTKKAKTMTARQKLMAIITDRNIPKTTASGIVEEIMMMFAEIEVTVVVKGGVAEVTKNPCGVTVDIKDLD